MSLKRVLFVCIGNSCRSQMAEGFARAYGGGVIEPSSAGVAPAFIVQPLTRQVMAARNISIDNQFPKDILELAGTRFDLVVNMSGRKLPIADCPIVDWKVDDPIGSDEKVYCTVRDRIEQLVMKLVLDFRLQAERETAARRRGRERRNPQFP